MEKIQVQVPAKEELKRMMEMSKLPDGRDFIAINFSSLSVISECMRKAKYLLLDNLRNETEADALTFGKAIHKALEHWYCLPEADRQLTKKELEIADTLLGGPLTEEGDFPTAINSINEFVKAAQPLQWLGAEDKRSIANGIKILKAYFKHYEYDGLEICRDESGNPYIEEKVEFKMFENDKMVINFHGTIDAILKSKINGQIYIADHKTTAALGSAFYNRIKPNHQYTGYIMAAKECLGIDTNHFLVNGIQVAKTKCEFARQATERYEEDFQELKEAVVEAVERVLKAKSTGIFPMASPGSCSNYGSCPYLDICNAPAKLRETIIKSKYDNK